MSDSDLEAVLAVVTPPLRLPEWGAWPVPNSAPVVWGARMIYNLLSDPVRDRRGQLVKYAYRADLDIVPDRHEMIGGTNDERRALARWIDERALPEIKATLAEKMINGGSNLCIEIERDGFACKAGPRASHGYVYMRAWMVRS